LDELAFRSLILSEMQYALKLRQADSHCFLMS
jgi:hypothetical protein